jgi:hypothetical protein
MRMHTAACERGAAACAPAAVLPSAPVQYTGEPATLRVDPADVTLQDAEQRCRPADDIALRNSGRPAAPAGA